MLGMAPCRGGQGCLPKQVIDLSRGVGPRQEDAAVLHGPAACGDYRVRKLTPKAETTTT
jgi:hypothetical protein